MRLLIGRHKGARLNTSINEILRLVDVRRPIVSVALINEILNRTIVEAGGTRTNVWD